MEPGTRLAGRYRLESRISQADGSTLWKAIDEILARAVAVRTFAPDFPHVADVVTAARAASRLTDPRLTQVFDADDNAELAYVVSEWVSGETLQDMVTSRGPLEPGRAATLLYEAAEAIAAAHAAGLAHLRLGPDDLLWTTGGTVKLLGLGVEAALFGETSDDPALVDAQGLGRMLYVGLTAHSASVGEGRTEEEVLPAAPLVNGRLSAPRWLQPGIPEALDAIVCRTLGLGPGETPDPLTSPAALAEALAGVHRTPLPLFAGLGSPPATVSMPRTTPTTVPQAPPPASVRRQPPPRSPRPASGHSVPGPHPVPPTPPATRPTAASYPPGPAADRPPVNRPLVAIAAALATVVVGMGGWQLTHMGGSGSGAADPARSPTSSSLPKPEKLEVTGAQGVDVTHGDPTAQSTGANAVDDSSSSAWRTQTYATSDFGRLKKGLGVLVDMGRPVKLDNVKVTLPGESGGGTLELRVGTTSDFDALELVDRKPEASGTVDLRPAQPPITGRYVLLWFTKLPASHKAQISDVGVFGWKG
jgi:hypothetical protein